MRFGPSIGAVVASFALLFSACSDAADLTAPRLTPGASASQDLVSAQQAGGPTRVISKLSESACLDVSGGSRSAGARMIVYTCHGNENQQFTLPAPGTTGEIRVYGSLCLDAAGGAGLSGDPVIVWSCHGGENQRWTVTAAGELKGVNGRCMDVWGAVSTNLTPVQLHECHGGANQQWTNAGTSGAAPTPAPTPAPGPAPIASPATPGQIGAAELPRVRVAVDYVTPTGRVIVVNSGGSLQAAINEATSGDDIVLQAGASFVGNFVLPNKGDVSQPITIRSSALGGALPGAGTRVSPADAGAMPKLLTPNAAPALKALPGTRNWQLVGLEIAAAASAPLNYGLLALGDVGSAQNTLAAVPSRIVVDRSYIHGNSTLALRRCVALNSSATAIVNSYLADCHERGPDSQAIAGWNGPGPFRIENNYLEAGHEVVAFGGSDPSIQGLVPSDIEIRRNHITRPMSWQGRWDVKNLIEFKTGQRVLIQGNVIENNWADLQTGFAILLWSNNQDGNAPWTVTQDLTLRDNVIRNTSHVLNIAAKAANPSITARRISVHNNLMYKIGAPSLGPGGRAFQLLGELRDIYISNNTVFAVSHLTLLEELTQANFKLLGNVFGPTSYGVYGGGAGEGTSALARYAPGAEVLRNVFVGSQSSLYPTGNLFPANTAEIGMSGLAAGDYSLGSTAPSGPTVGGQPTGADFAALAAQTTGVVR